MRSLSLLLLLLGASPAAAEIELQSVQWQRVERVKGQPAKAADISALTQKPKGGLDGRLQARVKLLNRGPGLEGVLLRYALTANIGPIDGKHDAVWAVPFATDEKRVPKVAANLHQEVVLDPSPLIELYLKRIYRDGYWPKELKLQVMVAPRKGTGQLRVLESVLPVIP